jgi:hypothetical protein
MEENLKELINEAIQLEEKERELFLKPVKKLVIKREPEIKKNEGSDSPVQSNTEVKVRVLKKKVISSDQKSSEKKEKKKFIFKDGKLVEDDS